MTLDMFDWLGLLSKSWNMDDSVKFLNSLSAPVGIGFFDNPWPNSFNPGADARVHINRLVATGKVSAIRPHIWWDKNHATNPHAICPEPILQARAQLWNTWAQNHPGITVYLSHTCESSEKDLTERQKRITIIKHLAPLTIPVECVLPGVSTVPGILVEEHGTHATTHGNEGASFDGNNAADEDDAAWEKNNNGVYRAFWGQRYNLSESGPFIECNARTASPDIKYHQAMDYFRHPQPQKPTPVFKTIPLTKPDLYKVLAEDSPGVNGRDNKPMLWLENEASNPVTVVTFDNQVIGEFIHFADVRWYSGMPGGLNLYGFEIAQKAIALSKSPYVAFKINGKYYELEDAGRRGDFFQ